MITTETKRGVFALMWANCAGMMDLVAMPVWVGTLIAGYRFDPQQAGGLVTLFLIGMAFASVVFAPRLNKFDPKHMAVTGFGIAALMFLWATQSSTFIPLAIAHLVGGLSAGMALTFTHGTVGRASNPHRIFALAGLSIGIFGIVFLGATPKLIGQFGHVMLFWAMAAMMIVTFLIGLFWFPRPGAAFTSGEHASGKAAPFDRAVWYAIAAVAFMCMAQAMTISFYQRTGLARGFTDAQVNTALIIYGIVTIIPGPLAGLLQNKLKATAVVCTVPILQIIFAMVATHTTNYTAFVIGGAMMPFAIILTHTFAFGLLARLDPTGRAVAATPAMLMVGSAIGPFLSGTLVKFFSYEAIGYGVFVVVVLELLFFNLARMALKNKTLA